MGKEKNLNQEELNEQNSANTENQLKAQSEWDAPAKLMNGEPTHTLTGDIVGDVSEEMLDAAQKKMAEHLRDEITKSLAVTKNEEGKGISTGEILCNRIKVVAEMMGIDTITRRDAMMAVAGVLAAKDELKIKNIGKLLGSVVKEN